MSMVIVEILIRLVNMFLTNALDPIGRSQMILLFSGAGATQLRIAGLINHRDHPARNADRATRPGE